MTKLFKSYDYHPRKYRKGILKSKGHNYILKSSPFCGEGSLPSIFWYDLDLLIPLEYTLTTNVQEPP